MRYVKFSGVFVALFMVGCREQAIQSAAKDRAEFHQAESSAADELPPSKRADTSTSAEKPAGAASAVVELDTIAFTAPANWERKPASSSFVAAEFSLPRVEGDDVDGRLTISTAGGSVQANIDRWKSQFAPQPSSASQEEVNVAGFKVTIVDFSGDFKDQRGPFAPGETRPGYRMIAAVIPIRSQLHFVKATGPKKSIATHADSIHHFIRSAKPRK